MPEAVGSINVNTFSDQQIVCVKPHVVVTIFTKDVVSSIILDAQRREQSEMSLSFIIYDVPRKY